MAYDTSMNKKVAGRYENDRYTKIKQVKTAGGVLRVGDLVSHWWSALSASRWIEGEIVDISRGKVCIEDSNGDQAWVYASHMSVTDIVLSAREA